jgi:hypothetical protein
MVKRITLLRRLEGMSPSEFSTHLLGPHAEIARRATNLRGYRVNLPRASEAAGWDAVVESWFDSEEGANWPEPIKSELMADRPQFVGHIEFFFVDDHTVVEPPARSG